MNILPDFSASDLDSEAFREFIGKHARSKAMEGWEREGTFLRGGEKCAAVPTMRELLEKVAAEKGAKWLSGLVGGGARLATQGAKAVTGPGGQGVASGLAQAPLRAAERGAHMGKTFLQDTASAFKGAPQTGKYFPGSAGVARMPGSTGARTAMSLGVPAVGAGSWMAGRQLLGGPGAPQEAPITHNPQGAAGVKPAAKPAAKPVAAPVGGPAAAASVTAKGVPPQPVPGAGVDQGLRAQAEAQHQRVMGMPETQAELGMGYREPQAPAGAQVPPQAAPAGEPAPRTPISQAEIARSPGMAGNVVAYRNQFGKDPSQEELSAWSAQRQQKNFRKRPSYYIDPKTKQRMEMTETPTSREWMPKQAAEAKDILKWLLGSALIGAGARTSVSLYHNIAGKDPLSAGEHLYDPEIEIPVDVTPEQMAKYKALRSPKAKKMAAAWDNTLAALTMTGGGALGWSLAHAMIRRAKERDLDTRLKKLRGELVRLSQPEIHAEGLGDEAIKQAAAEDFFHIAAERYELHIKEAGAGKAIVDLLRKARLGVRQGVREGKALGNKGVEHWQGMDPMMKVLAAGGAGLAAAPLVPGIRHVTKGVGDVATGGALAGLKTVGHPIGYGAAATLGPVAALGALYALYKGYEGAEKDDPQAAELKALREAVRQREIEERPYFKLTPRVLKEHSHAA